MSTHPFFKQTGIDISGEPDEDDKRSLAEVEAFARSDRYAEPTQETTEKYLQMREENRNSEVVKAARWEMQEELKDESEGRKGRILSEVEFIAMLQRVLTVKVNEWSARGLRGISGWKDGRWQYIGAMQCGFMWEYSVVHFTDHDVPTNEKYRGWRTVLLNVITRDFASERRVHEVFGMPDPGTASRRYRETLFRYRNRRQANG